MTAEAEKKIEQAQQTVEEQRAHVSGAVGKLMLASIGAVALAQESLESLLKRMVERGEQLQEDARKRADELRKKGRQVIGPRMRKIETALDTAELPSKGDIQLLQDRIAALSTQTDLPSKGDIQSLHDQIAALTVKVDHLSESKTKP